MHPHARIRTPDGRTVALGHGDLVGRLDAAALHLSDPRVSEAHAMVSLRGATLKLLALRGRLGVEGRRVSEVVLEPGLVVQLAQDLALEVVEVCLPERLVAVRWGGAEARVLAGVASLFGPAPCELRTGFHEAAIAYVWAGDGSVRLRRRGGADRTLVPGEREEVAGVALEVVWLALEAHGAQVTTAKGAVGAPLELVTRYESATLYRPDEPALTVTGVSARILSELVAFGAPVTWETLARELWPHEVEPAQLRARWDVNLGRLRRKLAEARVRTDLVSHDGRGNVLLVLEREDVVRDEA